MFILRLQCIDKPGIVAAVATALRDTGCNIEESAQFYEHSSGQFFMRVLFSEVQQNAAAVFTHAFKPAAQQFSMDWRVCSTSETVKCLILLSKEDHCAADLLYRWRSSALNIEPVAIASNHQSAANLAEQYSVPFHHLPLTAVTKPQQEQQIRDLIEQTGAELIVLARYMQILSDQFTQDYAGRIINIHHSFLPGFKGAKPYHQAYDRGVKLIGATAHFATPDLDEGPIITQEVQSVTHRDTPDMMQQRGRDTERRALAHAVQLYTERRIFVHGNRTVIL